MKTLMMLMFSVSISLFANVSSAQEVCEECTLPPQSIGAGGLTCAKAATAYTSGTSAKDVLGDYEGSNTYTMASEVYCYPRYGNRFPGGSAVTLTFRSSEIIDVLSGDYTTSVTADLENIMGNYGLESLNNPTTFTSSGDACFSRYQLFRDQWGTWKQSFQPHYFNYQCRVPKTNPDALICKVKYDGRIEIGYQVYSLSGSSGELPEGILE